MLEPFFCICSSQNGLISSTIIGDDVDAGWVLIFVASIWFQFPCLDKALTKPYTPWQSHGQKLGYITYISIWRFPDMGVFHDINQPAIGETPWTMEIAILSGSLPFFEGVAGPQGTGATRKCWGPWIAQDSEGPAVWNGQFLSPSTK